MLFTKCPEGSVCSISISKALHPGRWFSKTVARIDEMFGDYDIQLSIRIWNV